MDLIGDVGITGNMRTEPIPVGNRGKEGTSRIEGVAALLLAETPVAVASREGP